MEYKSELPMEAAIFGLYKKLGWSDELKLTPARILDAMRGSFFSVYVYNQEELIATGRVVSDGVINAYICGLGVLPEYRNRGIGTEIMKRLAAFCAERNLHIQFFCDEGLAAYYKKMGFKKFAVGMKKEV